MCLLNRCKENQFQFGVWTKAGRSGSGSMTVEYLSTESSRTLTPGNSKIIRLLFFKTTDSGGHSAVSPAPETHRHPPPFFVTDWPSWKSSRRAPRRGWWFQPVDPWPQQPLPQLSALHATRLRLSFPQLVVAGCTLAAAAVRPRLRSRRSPVQVAGAAGDAGAQGFHFAGEEGTKHASAGTLSGSFGVHLVLEAWGERSRGTSKAIVAWEIQRKNLPKVSKNIFQSFLRLQQPRYTVLKALNDLRQCCSSDRWF